MGDVNFPSLLSRLIVARDHLMELVRAHDLVIKDIQDEMTRNSKVMELPPIVVPTTRIERARKGIKNPKAVESAKRGWEKRRQNHPPNGRGRSIIDMKENNLPDPSFEPFAPVTEVVLKPGHVLLDEWRKARGIESK